MAQCSQRPLLFRLRLQWLCSLWNDQRSLWNDQRGAIASTEMIVMGTVVILGTIVGLASFRDAVVQEFGDMSAATAQLNQGYTYTEITHGDAVDKLRYEFFIAGSDYTDNRDFCVPEDPDPAGAAPMCIIVTADEIQDEI